MQDTFVVRIPKNKKGFFTDNYSLNEDDIRSLKDKAKSEGRSLRVFIAYNLKKIANA